jgi:O-antigen/teichoic acid export membrane protein
LDKNKQFAINMIAQVVGFVVMMGISFLLTPFIVEHVGSEAYGFVGLANNFVSYAQVITVALNSMASRFITIKITEKDVEGSNRYFTSVVIANIVTALVLSVPSALIILNLNKIVNVSEAILIDVQWLWAFIFLNFLVSIISSTYSVATFVRNKLY